MLTTIRNYANGGPGGSALASVNKRQSKGAIAGYARVPLGVKAMLLENPFASNNLGAASPSRVRRSTVETRRAKWRKVAAW